jgi:hypothetical protein
VVNAINMGVDNILDALDFSLGNLASLMGARMLAFGGPLVFQWGVWGAFKCCRFIPINPPGRKPFDTLTCACGAGAGRTGVWAIFTKPALQAYPLRG